MVAAHRSGLARPAPKRLRTLAEPPLAVAGDEVPQRSNVLEPVLPEEPSREREGEVQSHHEVLVTTSGDEGVDDFTANSSATKLHELAVAGHRRPDVSALARGGGVAGPVHGNDL